MSAHPVTPTKENSHPNTNIMSIAMVLPRTNDTSSIVMTASCWFPATHSENAHSENMVKHARHTYPHESTEGDSVTARTYGICLRLVVIAGAVRRFDGINLSLLRFYKSTINLEK